MKSTPARSYLFVPGDRPERFAKAHSSGADAIILDLEDSVAPGAKTAARMAVAEHLDSGQAAWVRVNGAGTPFFEADVECVARRSGILGIVLPKAEAAETLGKIRAVRPDIVLIPLVESALGLARLREVCAAPGVVRLAFGSVDLRNDLGLGEGPEALLAFQAQLVLESRVAGLPAPIDGVTLDARSGDAARADALRAKMLGFGAKLLIHPAQVAPVHGAFAGSEEERKWARRVLDEAAARPEGAFMLDGRMVDEPVVALARQILMAASES